VKNRRCGSREDFLYGSEAEPALQDFKKGYLVRGNTVTLEDSMAGWCKALYKASEMLAVKWMKCRSIVFQKAGIYASNSDTYRQEVNVIGSKRVDFWKRGEE